MTDVTAPAGITVGGAAPIVDGVLNLATSVMNFLGLKEEHKYVDRVRAIQLEIHDEESKPYDDINDAKIEDLNAQFKIEFDALQSSVLAALAAKTK